VDRRLQAEVAAAQIEPSSGLRRRTIAALNDVGYEPAFVAARPRTAGASYAVGFLTLIALGALAVRLGVTTGPGQQRVVEPPSILAGFDTSGFDTLIRTQLLGLEDTWESSLPMEAKHIAADARRAGEYVLATLPLPSMWTLTSPGR
jgi:hypothetical protein